MIGFIVSYNRAFRPNRQRHQLIERTDTLIKRFHRISAENVRLAAEVDGLLNIELHLLIIILLRFLRCFLR